MAHLHGKAGNVYSQPTVILPTSASWDAGSNTATSNIDGQVYFGGTDGAVRATSTSAGAAEILMSDAIASTDLSGFDAISYWIRSSVSTSAGNLEIHISESSSIATPAETLDVPALSAAAWQWGFKRFAAAGATRDAIISGGLYQVADLANGTFDLDKIEALKVHTGAKDWSISYDGDTVETTDFADAGVKTFIAGASGWSGSLTVNKDGAPLLTIGSTHTFALAESATDTQEWIGSAIITNISPSTTVDDIVVYTYSFQGTGALQTAVA